MPGSKKGMVTRVLIGRVPVFSKKLIVVDPATLEDFRSDKKKRGKRKRDFSYSGACAAVELKLKASELKEGTDDPVAIVTSAPKNQDYPVYALVRDGKIVRLVVVFDEDPCGERPRTRRRREARD